MSFKNTEVLNFYEELPFNIYGDLDLAAQQVKKWDPLSTYPELRKIVYENNKRKIIDIGCGGGWLVNSLSFFHNEKIEIIGTDFNPVAIKYAEEVKKKCNLNSKFITSDLFEYRSKSKYDLIISLGVLHHTNNCHEAIKHICSLGKNDSFLFLGLYHKYGRQPFLDHFKNMQFKSESYKFSEYKKLHKGINDEKKLYSWFRDQVLHPHETQHTFQEISKVLHSINFSIISTSINKFEKINSQKEIIEMEKEYFEISKKKIQNSEYFPGFFIICAKNNVK